MENFGWTVLASIIGSSVIFFTQRYYRNSDIKEMEKIKSEIQKDREVFLGKLRLYSEVQFKLYNDLWANLSELESIVEELWSGDLTPKGVKDLARAVRATDKKMRESALIIEGSDYKRLERVINTLKSYQAGKEKLLSLDDVDENASSEIQRQIERNFDLRTEYVELKEKMFKTMREKVGF